MAVSLGRPLPDWALREAPSATEAELLVLRIKAMLMASTGALTPSKLRKLKVLRAQMDELKQKTPSKGLKDVVQACVLDNPELLGEDENQPAPPESGIESGAGDVERPSTPALAVVA